VKIGAEKAIIYLKALIKLCLFLFLHLSYNLGKSRYTRYQKIHWAPV